MTTDTLISRIQLRRGTLEQLPILKEGELGYAMDVKRLFIGNASQAFIADDSAYYDLDFKIARPNQILVFVDNTQKTAGVHYTIVGTRLTFNNPMPAAGSLIEVGVNNEIVLDKADVPNDILPIIGSATDEYTGIFFDVTVYNTAVIDYSFKGTDNNMQIGRIDMITDGTTVGVYSSKHALSSPVLTFGGEIMDGQIRLLYSNSGSASGTFNYTIKAWFT